MTNLDFTVNGQRVRLSPNNFLSEGGEGQIYAQGSTVYKIYPDPSKMIPIGKIQELSVLALSNIICPQQIIKDSKGKIAGYTMTKVNDAIALVSTFTKTFRDRENLTPDKALRMARKLQEGIAYIHSKDILIVDANEWNFLVDKNFHEVFFIDVNSYQTKSFPATAIMPSIQDFSAKTFTANSDWYSFAIVAFQMLTGIHPFKGTLAEFDKYPKDQRLMERMKQNASVFRAGVTMPASTLPLSVIPPVYLEWFKRVFEKGERCPPPDSLIATILVAAPVLQRVAGSNNLDISHLFDVQGSVYAARKNITASTIGLFTGGVKCGNGGAGAVIGETIGGQPIAAWTERGMARFYDIASRKPVACALAAEQLMASEGRIYFKSGGKLFQAQFVGGAGNYQIGAKLVGNVMTNATRLYEGIALQNLMGNIWASLFPLSGGCVQVEIPELNKYRIVEAKFEKNVLIVAGGKGSKYEKLIFRFAPNLLTYDVRIVPDVTAMNVNFTVLDSNVCIYMNDNEEIEMFSTHPHDPNVKTLKDAAVDSSCHLFSYGVEAMFYKENDVYKFSMKK